jgi:hypothetical protein
LEGIWIGFWFLVFWRNFWRRGAHVNVPKIGSRGAGNCLGEFLGVYAVLRRDLIWRNLNWVVFGFLFEVPRRGIEEGGQLVHLLRIWGILFGELTYCVNGVT